MVDHEREGRKVVAQFEGLFRGPQVPLVTGVPVRNTTRYSHHPQDAAVYFGQLVAIELVPHRILRGREEVQGYLDEVLGMPWPRLRQGQAWEARLEITQAAVAHYRSGVITVPEVVREPVVLHEVAHHFAPVPVGHHGSRTPEHHGAAWVAAYLDLIEHVMNPAAASMFRECFAAEGVPT